MCIEGCQRESKGRYGLYGKSGSETVCGGMETSVLEDDVKYCHSFETHLDGVNLYLRVCPLNYFIILHFNEIGMMLSFALNFNVLLLEDTC